MKLKVKEEYLEYSIGGGRLKKMKLHNIPTELYQKYYDMGFQEFFEVEEEKKKSVKNDKTNKRRNSISLSDTNGESDSE